MSPVADTTPLPVPPRMRLHQEAVSSVVRSASLAEADRTETALREHLATHTPEQFGRVIHDLRVEVTALRERPVSGEETSA